MRLENYVLIGHDTLNKESSITLGEKEKDCNNVRFSDPGCIVQQCSIFLGEKYSL